ncbi:MAG: phospho-sugar mutase [Lachnospiraceae bacterium]|nr:phospho-sugar mutase [Lachnospiraceae bacterium]
MSEAKKKLEYWLSADCFDEATKEELKGIAQDEAEVTDRFYKDLEFGTGGLRGVLGAGSNRLNIYTIRKATQGLADYIKKELGDAFSDAAALNDYIVRHGGIAFAGDGTLVPAVAVSYDCRRMSPEFADETARVLAANGIRAYVSDRLRPTPELSFMMRIKHCVAGVMITASHNPPEYNGYKAYWTDGAQVTPPHDTGIIDCVNAITDYADAKIISKEEAKEKELYKTVGEDVDDLYMEALKKEMLHPEAIEAQRDRIKIVYSPFHGCGLEPVKRLLAELGYKNVFIVPEQADPDPEFTTLDYPNPEDPKAFEYALRYAKEQGADIVLATDPDADRLGVYVRRTYTPGEGSQPCAGEDASSFTYEQLTGNMSGMLIGEYVFRERKALGKLPENPAFVSTIVTTRMAVPIAAAYGARYIDVLTGFKYIGEQIKQFEATGSNHYVFGLEESYGCLAGTHARDKDAIVAVMLLCELTAFYKEQGKSAWDAMIDLYETYGYYKEGQFSLTMKGAEGAKEIAALMDRLRKEPPKRFGDWTVEEFRDYKSGETLALATGEKGRTGLPSSNVLYFKLTEDAWVCARPSGTEPKIKFYMGVKGTSLADAADKLNILTETVRGIAE